jgi:hypothetical protein
MRIYNFPAFSYVLAAAGTLMILAATAKPHRFVAALSESNRSRCYSGATMILASSVCMGFIGTALTIEFARSLEWIVWCRLSADRPAAMDAYKPPDPQSANSPA